MLPKKEAVCAVSSQSFIKTFDNRFLTFPGICTYQLAADCIDDTFVVHMHYGVDHKDQLITLYLGDIDIVLTSNEVFVNNQFVVLPFIKKSVLIENIAGYVIVDGWNGLSVKWDGKSLYLELHPIYANKTCGLCGNFNGNPIDDVADVNGHITESVSSYGKSWKKTKVGELCHDNEVLQEPLPSDGIKNSSSPCKKLIDAPEFQVCHSLVSPDPYFKRCIDVLFSCKNKQDCLCSILTEYSRECGRMGKVLDWRQNLCCKFLINIF